MNVLTDIGVTTEESLSFIQFEDLPADISLITRRKLDIIRQFLAKGNSLNATIEMTEVSRIVNVPVSTSGTSVSLSDPDLIRGAPKVHTNFIANFSGDVVDFEEWSRRAGATIKQSQYKKLIERTAEAGNVVEETRSQELYNMLLNSVADGHALNLVEKARDDNGKVECGYTAWKALHDWYLSREQQDSMIAHWEKKLRNLQLDQDTSATEYINSFEMYVRKLTELGENWSDAKKVRE